MLFQAPMNGFTSCLINRYCSVDADSHTKADSDSHTDPEADNLGVISRSTSLPLDLLNP